MGEPAVQFLMMPCYLLESKDDNLVGRRALGGVFEGLRTLVWGVHPSKALNGGKKASDHSPSREK